MLKSRLAVAAVAVAALGGGVAAVAVPSAGAATAHRGKAKHGKAVRAQVVVRMAKVHVVAGSSNKLREVLVDAAGKAVYTLSGNTPTHPKCIDVTCLTAWPAVTTTAKRLVLGKGVKGKLAIWHHGKLSQVTLDGRPLYTFAADTVGTASGEGINNFGGVWELVKANGAPMPKNAGKTTSTSKSGSGW